VVKPVPQHAPRPKPPAEPESPPKPPPRAQRCRAWLADRLAGRGPVSVGVLVDEGQRLGFGRSEVRRAATQLGALHTGSIHAPLGSEGRPHWELPQTAPGPTLSTERPSTDRSTA
jgi:hypothetical protein